MARSIAELAAIINSVGVAGRQAHNSIGRAIEDIEVALRSLPELGEGTQPMMMVGMYKRCLAELHDAQGHIDHAHDVGQAMIDRLHG